jgi:hypothetical protein
MMDHVLRLSLTEILIENLEECNKMTPTILFIYDVTNWTISFYTQNIVF